MPVSTPSGNQNIRLRIIDVPKIYQRVICKHFVKHFTYIVSFKLQSNSVVQVLLATCRRKMVRLREDHTCPDQTQRKSEHKFCLLQVLSSYYHMLSSLMTTPEKQCFLSQNFLYFLLAKSILFIAYSKSFLRKISTKTSLDEVPH